MEIDAFKTEYDESQRIYGDPNLDAYVINKPDIMFVFMNPTVRNIASNKSWKGIKSPWVGTKNIWDLFEDILYIKKNFLNEEVSS